LDALVLGIRDRHQRLTGGSLAIHRFYFMLGRPSVFGQGANSHDWRLPALETWAATDTGSLAARVALSQYHWSLAWELRGTSFANDLSEEQSAGFDAHLRMALAALAPNDATRDAQAAELSMQLVHIAARPREQLDRMFQQMVREFPEDEAAYGLYAMLLERKWYGRPGELTAWLDSLARQPGGERGQLAYAQAMISLGARPSLEYLQADHARRWPVLRETMRLREARYGLSEANAELLLWWAARFLDRDTARHALTLVRDYHDYLWASHDDMAVDIAWAAGPERR
jgi:hypothetical protein